MVVPSLNRQIHYIICCMVVIHINFEYIQNRRQQYRIENQRPQVKTILPQDQNTFICLQLIGSLLK